MGARGKAEKGLEGRHRGAPPVETKGELVQVGLEVIVTDAVVGAAKPGLEVAKDSVDVRSLAARAGCPGCQGDAGSQGPTAARKAPQPSVRMKVPCAIVRFTNPVSERADASDRKSVV